MCPLISRCSRKVDIDTFRNVCSNVAADEYKNCPEFQKIASTPRTPSEWTSLLSLVTSK